MKHQLWRLLATFALVAGGLAFASPAQANNTGSADSRSASSLAAEDVARGDMLQRRPNFLETELSLSHLRCGPFGDRTVWLRADNVVVVWSCERGRESQYAQVGRERLRMGDGGKLVVRDGRACVQSRWSWCRGPRDWVPTWERPSNVHRFLLSEESRRPGPGRGLQADVPVTGQLNRWTALNAQQRGNTLTLGGRGGWPVQH